MGLGTEYIRHGKISDKTTVEQSRHNTHTQYEHFALIYKFSLRFRNLMKSFMESTALKFA